MVLTGEYDNLNPTRLELYMSVSRREGRCRSHLESSCSLSLPLLASEGMREGREGERGGSEGRKEGRKDGWKEGREEDMPHEYVSPFSLPSPLSLSLSLFFFSHFLLFLFPVLFFLHWRSPNIYVSI
jgi:hypothetical protein